MKKYFFSRYRFNKCIKRRVVSAVLILSACTASLTGCTMKKQEPTTQARTVDEDTLTDEEGFRTVKDYVVTVQDGVKIRRTPEEDGEVYITLDKGVDLSRTGVKEEWTRLLINGSSFYVQSKYLEETTIKWATETDVDTENHIIYIDPAKQITEDLSLEPVSPEVDIAGDIPATASGTNAERAGLKAKMTAASVGISSGIFEYDITMSVANYLNAELVKRGYTVYLSRTTNNVNLSNAKRAQMANASGAEVYIKLEAASSRDETATGELGFITTSANSHNGALYQKNYELCYDVLKTTCQATESARMGIYETDNMTSLNYCNMPAMALNMGFLSYELDDINLNNDDFKKKMAVGIADGIDLYFQSIKQK